MRPVVACVLVRGNVPYTADYVTILQSMVERQLPEHEFICLTDQPKEVASAKIQAIEIPTPFGVFGWWSKLHLFSPRTMKSFTGRRCVYFDLDVGLMGSIDAIVSYEASFALVPDDAPNFRGKNGRGTVKKFNSSVMVWTVGEQDDLYTKFEGKIARRLWGDQDWIGCLRDPGVNGVQTMPLEWFPRISQCSVSEPKSGAKVVLCKKPKPHKAVETYPWFKEVWH